MRFEDDTVEGALTKAFINGKNKSPSKLGSNRSTGRGKNPSKYGSNGSSNQRQKIGHQKTRSNDSPTSRALSAECQRANIAAMEGMHHITQNAEQLRRLDQRVVEQLSKIDDLEDRQWGLRSWSRVLDILPFVEENIHAAQEELEANPATSEEISDPRFLLSWEQVRRSIDNIASPSRRLAIIIQRQDSHTRVENQTTEEASQLVDQIVLLKDLTQRQIDSYKRCLRRP